MQEKADPYYFNEDEEFEAGFRGSLKEFKADREVKKAEEKVLVGYQEFLLSAKSPERVEDPLREEGEVEVTIGGDSQDFTLFLKDNDELEEHDEGEEEEEKEQMPTKRKRAVGEQDEGEEEEEKEQAPARREGQCLP